MMIELLKRVKEFFWCLFMLVDLLKNSSTITDVVAIIDLAEDRGCVMWPGLANRIDIIENFLSITFSVVIVELVEDFDGVVSHCIAKINLVKNIVDIGALFVFIDLIEGINDVEWILMIIDLTEFVHDIRLCLDWVDLVENIDTSLDVSVVLLGIGIILFN
jgi:hypothetical protein